jgi:hypothetical protein
LRSQNKNVTSTLPGRLAEPALRSAGADRALRQFVLDPAAVDPQQQRVCEVRSARMLPEP